jgi:type IX secretion system PorP/SprF family membrane protein
MNNLERILTILRYLLRFHTSITSYLKMTLMKYLLTLSLLLAFGAFAQNEPVSDMYWNNYSFSNPAMSGVDHKYEANVSHLTQFNQLGLPSSWWMNYGMNLAGNHGLGLNYVFERFQFSKTTRIKLNYNYQFQLNGDRKLAIGTAASFRRNSIIPLPFICYIGPLKRQGIQLDFGVAYFGNKITAGLALTQIPLHENSSFFVHTPHLTGNFRNEGLLNFPWGTLILETKFQTDFERYRQDFNLGINIGDFLEVGAGYRTSDAVLVNLTGIIAKKYRIGYSYAHMINDLGSSDIGTHEFTLGIRIPNN